MTWHNELVLILRHLINDLDSSDETYDDDRLEETLVVAAQLLIEEVDFEQTYTIDVDAHSITPNPTASGSKDDGFINLVCLKAATIILRGETKNLAGKSYTIRDGPSVVDVKGAYQATKDTLDEMNDVLDKAIMQFKMGRCVSGKAILSSMISSHVGSRGDVF